MPSLFSLHPETASSGPGRCFRFLAILVKPFISCGIAPLGLLSQELLRSRWQKTLRPWPEPIRPGGPGWARARSIPVVILALLVLGGAAQADTVKIPATPAAPVVDLAGIMDSAAETRLNRYLKELQTKTGAQMAILTINSLAGQPIEEFSISIAHDQWKLGQKGKDNGVLMIISLKDSRYRIEIGYGLEGLLPDSLVGSIGRQCLVPYFRKGDYSTGIYAAAVVIANEIARDAGVEITGLPAIKQTYATPKRLKSSGTLGKILSLLFFVVMAILFIKNPRMFLAFMLLSSMGGRRGHWAGSGGGFGGGGASGGW